MGRIEENYQDGQQKRFDANTKVLDNVTRFSSVNYFVRFASIIHFWMRTFTRTRLRCGENLGFGFLYPPRLVSISPPHDYS